MELQNLSESKTAGKEEKETSSDQVPDKKSIASWKPNGYKLGLILILVTVLICAIFFAIWTAANKQVRYVCNQNLGYDFNSSCGNQTKCNIAAQEILQGLNKSVDPCDNFYEFACGGWESQNPIPDYQHAWRASSVRSTKMEDVFISILEEAKKNESPATTPVSMASDYFHECLSLPKNYNDQNRGTRQIWETLEQFGGWPILYTGANMSWNTSRFDWVESVVALQKNFGAMRLFTMHPYQRNNASLNILRILSPVSAGTMPQLAGKEESIFEAYTQYIVSMFHELREYSGNKATLNRTELHQMATKIARTTKMFEELDSSWASKRTMPELLTVESLQEQMNRQNISVDLLQLVNQFYNGTGADIEKTQLVLQPKNMTYFAKMCQTVSEVGPEEMANFLHFEMARKMAQLLPLPNFHKFEDKIYDVRNGSNQNERIKRKCIYETLAFFREALIPDYLKHQEVGNFTQVNNLFGNIRESFWNVLDKFHDLGLYEEGKEYIISLKICTATLCISHAPWTAADLQLHYTGIPWNGSMGFLAQNMILNNWKFSKDLALIYQAKKLGECPRLLIYPRVPQGPFFVPYVFDTDYVHLGLSDLQMPFYHESLPRSLIYGRLGYTLGHEIAHGTEGLDFSSMSCLQNQYSTFHHNHETVSNVSVNGNNTVHENFADNAAMHVVYQTYLANLDNHIKHGMKGLEDYTNEQLFFIGFAQNWCFSATPKGYKRLFLEEATHAPDDVRVLGTLQNFKEFSMAWNCSVGTKMNPAPSQVVNKCKIW